MKKVKILYSILIPLLLFSTSCDDDYLEYEPVDEITDNSWWKNVDQYVQFINGAYNEYNYDEGSSTSWIVAGNIPLGDFRQGGLVERETYFNASYGNHKTLWEYHYRVVNKMNTVLDKIPLLEDADDQVRIEAEARFLRGFSRLMLHRAYGEIHIKQTPPSASDPVEYPRDPVDVVRAAIMEDFDYAVNNLPDTWGEWTGYDVGRPLKGSALGYRMLAKMYAEDWNGAIADFQAIEQSSRGYRLLDNFRDVFTLANENSVESLFEIQYHGPIAGWFRVINAHWLNEVTMPPGSGGQFTEFGGWGNWAISPEFANSFEDGDTRRATAIIGVGETFVGEMYEEGVEFVAAEGHFATGFGCTKYWVGPERWTIDAGGHGSSLNTPALRFSEAILNYAEAQARVGNVAEAYNQLNRVRARAGLGAKNGGDLQQFLSDVTMERRHEAFAEPNLWFDLVRSGMAAEALADYGVSMQEHWKLLPIHTDELTTNTEIAQNKGY